MLSVQNCYVHQRGKSMRDFYGDDHAQTSSSMPEVGWRIVIDMKWAIRTRFASARDAHSAKAALERENLTTTDTIIEAGWHRVRRIIFEALPW